MSGEEVIDYKAKCEELAKTNVELTAQVESLKAVADILKAKHEELKKEFDSTVASHNQIRDHIMTQLSTLNAQVANSRFLNTAELAQQKLQAEQLKAQLTQEKQ